MRDTLRDPAEGSPTDSTSHDPEGHKEQISDGSSDGSTVVNGHTVVPTVEPGAVVADGIPLREDPNIPQAPIVTESGLARLQRPHRRRKLILTIGVSLITLDLCVLPIVYYYALKFGTNLSVQDSMSTTLSSPLELMSAVLTVVARQFLRSSQAYTGF